MRSRGKLTTTDRLLAQHVLAELLLSNEHQLRWAIGHAIKYTETHNLPKQRRMYQELLEEIESAR